MKYLVFLPLTAFLLTGCPGYEESDFQGCHDPVYLSYTDLREKFPAIEEPRAITQAGNIYVYGDTLLINEKGKGLHIVDNSNKSAPLTSRFLNIPGNTNIAIKSDHLYIDSFTDLIVLDISNQSAIEVVYRKQDVFPYDPDLSLSDEDREKDHCPSDANPDYVIIGYE